MSVIDDDLSYEKSSKRETFARVFPLNCDEQCFVYYMDGWMDDDDSSTKSCTIRDWTYLRTYVPCFVYYMDIRQSRSTEE